MRRARITYPGAFHHAMNRGHGGEPIFRSDWLKNTFLNLLEEKSKLLRIRIFAYCIMDNHYHLVLENSSGRMSDFFKQLNGQFGNAFRQKYGGKGYVFQNRFKSTLIQNESYLLLTIAYILGNPLRARIVDDPFKYEWSSASLYFKNRHTPFIDKLFIEDLFRSEKNLPGLIVSSQNQDLPTVRTEMGEIIGEKDFISEAISRYDRRSGKESVKRKRIDDYYFDPVEKVIFEFERKHGVKIEDIDIYSFSGKRLRGKLLVLLKDQAGLKYSEIIEFPIFSTVKMHSLGRLYRDAKERLSCSP